MHGADGTVVVGLHLFLGLCDAECLGNAQVHHARVVHEIAQREGLHHSTVNELLHLTLLEPAIIQSILAGQQPKCMSLLWFQRNPLPTDWMDQREVVAAFDS